MASFDDDERFSRFSTDPKFKTVPRKKKKVKIDSRFGALFTDKTGNFAAPGSTVDKRGRPVKKGKSQRDNYEKYYRIKDSSSDDSSSDDDDEKEQTVGRDKKVKRPPKKVPVDPEIKTKLRDPNVDYARGEGNLFSDSSSEDDDDESEDSSDDEDGVRKSKRGDDGELEFDKWGELDHDADRTEEATKRMAVCNMNWDRVGAEDIFIAMSSFCPTGEAGIKSVKLYLSDFGRKRKAEEDQLGPEELRKGDNDVEEDSSSSSDEENHDQDIEAIDKKAMERVRKYQVNRLKYYYAVVEFDSANSANKVYEECDGTEYELSATQFDLRFIPDDMDFEEEPEAVCETMPDPNKYRPKQFSTTALTLGKVELTWDETDPERRLAMRKAFEEGDENNDGAMAFVAMSSSDEGEDGGDTQEDGVDSDDSGGDAIEKYKALLGDIMHTEKEKAEEKGNMQISWGSSDKTKKDLEQKEIEKMTPWEQYLHKKKAKTKAKREERKLKNKGESEEAGGEQQTFSDDELPEGVDFDDPFFKDELDEREKKDKKKNKKKKGKKAEEQGDNDDKDLSLLVMEEEDNDKRHFDYRDIVAAETKAGKRKKKKRKMQQEADDFELDLKDNRFDAMFDNPDFNVDPSNPHFKKTKEMQQIIDEKQRRLASGKNQSESPASKKRRKDGDDDGASTSNAAGSSLDHLVKAVKSKTKASSEKSKAGKKKSKAK